MYVVFGHGDLHFLMVLGRSTTNIPRRWLCIIQATRESTKEKTQLSKSKENKGTKLTIKLPLERQTPKTPKPHFRFRQKIKEKPAHHFSTFI